MLQKHSSTVPDPQKPETTRKGEHKGRPGWLGFFRKLLWAWWLWLAVAGIAQAAGNGKLAIIFGAMSFFFYLVEPRETVPGYGLDPKFPVESHEFLSSAVGATGVPFIKNNKLTVMNNGDEFYPVMLDAIRDARRTITMEAYIYWAGNIGQQFAEVMAERARAGVTVKLLLDAFGSANIGNEILKLLQDSGCEVNWYNRVWPKTLGRYNHRDHRKSLIIDGRIAFTGGAGIADHWLGHAQDPQHWRDIHIRLEGPGAVGLQAAFAQTWLETTGELVSGEGFFPPPDSVGTLATQTILSSPKSGASAVRIMYYLSIVSARKSIYIANAYFVPDDSAVRILVEAAHRGVDVKVMVAGIHNDMKVSRYASIHGYGKLLEAGIEIYEYSKTMLHQKTMVVDNIWSTIGTTNFDNRSFALDEESNVCVYDRRLAEELEGIFRNDLKDCEKIDLQSWRDRGVKKRVLGSVCALLKEQI